MSKDTNLGEYDSQFACYTTEKQSKTQVGILKFSIIDKNALDGLHKYLPFFRREPEKSWQEVNKKRQNEYQNSLFPT